jgi:hypothetical protein
MQPSQPPRFEFRAWSAEPFPGLLPPAGEFAEEVYLIPLGLAGRDIKIRDGALEIKELLLERDGLQLWDPAVRLEFPVPASSLERELMTRLMLNQPLARPRYGREELLDELVAARRRNIAVVPVRKRRRVMEAAGCRAEAGEVELGGGGGGRRRVFTAAAEHEDPARLRRALAELGLEGRANLDYPAALARALPLPGVPPRGAAAA